MSEVSGANDAKTTYDVTFLVVGGGIAGVSCAEMLAICCPQEPTLLLTESSVIKTVTNLEPVARYLHKFDVKERAILSDNANGVRDDVGMAPCIITVVDKLKCIKSETKHVVTQAGRIINYEFLCLCTGGRPKLIAENNNRILGIRDTDSVLDLQQRLKNAKSVVLVGNGGIASELANELKNVVVHWVVKDKHISATFVDAGAAHFFIASRSTPIPTAVSNTDSKPTASGAIKRLRYSELVPAEENSSELLKRGPALGPDWHRSYALTGNQEAQNCEAPIIHYTAQIEDIVEHAERNCISVKLTSGENIECDFIVSATGVDPNHSYTTDKAFKIANDGGIEVNGLMETNISNIYAAGDVCHAAWDAAPHWFQMRLWTQARQMGAMAGRSMAAAFSGEEIYQDFCFEIFGHVTELFGFPVVLLGRFNAQDLGRDYELLLRMTPGKEYIKFVLQNGRLRGAILIGNTELAETCENLLLNGIDLTPFGDDILNPDIDIEDYFD